jgi:uncharacterized membrane protein
VLFIDSSNLTIFAIFLFFPICLVFGSSNEFIIIDLNCRTYGRFANFEADATACEIPRPIFVDLNLLAPHPISFGKKAEAKFPRTAIAIYIIMNELIKARLKGISTVPPIKQESRPSKIVITENKGPKICPKVVR